MDPPNLRADACRKTIANAVVAEGAEAALLCPALTDYDISLSRGWFQRAIEKKKKKKESRQFLLRSALDVTEHCKPPRAVFLPFMMGHHFGVPFSP